MVYNFPITIQKTGRGICFCKLTSFVEILSSFRQIEYIWKSKRTNDDDVANMSIMCTTAKKVLFIWLNAGPIRFKQRTQKLKTLTLVSTQYTPFYSLRFSNSDCVPQTVKTYANKRKLLKNKNSDTIEQESILLKVLTLCQLMKVTGVNTQKVLKRNWYQIVKNRRAEQPLVWCYLQYV